MGCVIGLLVIIVLLGITLHLITRDPVEAPTYIYHVSQLDEEDGPIDGPDFFDPEEN